MINYDNESERKGKKFKLRIKLNHNIYNLLTISYSLLTYFSGWTKVAIFFSSNDVICQYVINGWICKGEMNKTNYKIRNCHISCTIIHFSIFHTFSVVLSLSHFKFFRQNSFQTWGNRKKSHYMINTISKSLYT